jgi:hypothetical protein
MAYAHDWTKDTGNYNVGHRDKDGIVTYVRYIDTTATGYDLANGEYDKIFGVPDNFCVLSAYVIWIPLTLLMMILPQPHLSMTPR